MKTLILAVTFCAWFTTAAIAEPFAATVKGDLVALKGKRVSRFDDAVLANTKYYAIYFSASWCGPCKAFTPDLVKWYATTKPKHPEFELIFVSRDTDEAAMEAYMAADAMPWPALKYGKIARAKNIEELAGKGIPCLVFIDADGKVLSHSYVEGKYVGPRKVLAEIGQTLGPGAEPDAAATAVPATSTTKPGPASPQGSSFDQFFKKPPQ